MINWDEIRKEWETTKITLIALAEKYDIKLGTLKSRKSREAWVRGAPKKDAPKKEKDATISKRMQPQKEQFNQVVESENLTEKQRLFCIYYIKYFNATKAYQKAYGVNRNTAESIAYRLMGIDGVKIEIQRLKQQRLNEAYFDKYDVLQKYKDIAFADITDFVTFSSETMLAKDELGRNITDDEGNNITYNVNHVDFKNSEDVDGTIITEVKKGKDGVSLKLADKMKALEFLTKYTDLLSENDKKKLQEEKIKADTAKTNAEINRIQNDKSDEGPIEIIISSKKSK